MTFADQQRASYHTAPCTVAQVLRSTGCTCRLLCYVVPVKQTWTLQVRGDVPASQNLVKVIKALVGARSSMLRVCQLHVLEQSCQLCLHLVTIIGGPAACYAKLDVVCASSTALRLHCHAALAPTCKEAVQPAQHNGCPGMDYLLSTRLLWGLSMVLCLHVQVAAGADVNTTPRCAALALQQQEPNASSAVRQLSVCGNSV